MDGLQHYQPAAEKPAGYVDAQGHQYPQQYHDPNYAAAQHAQYHNGYTDSAAPAPAAAATGTKKGLLIGLLIAVAVLTAAVIGLAAGLGVSQNNLHSTQSDLSALMASVSPSATTSSSSTTTATKTSTSATASATTDAFSSCPGANNTVYTSSTDSKEFTVHCGIDYSGDGGADDLTSQKSSTMTACMDACAKNDECEGAGWGWIDGTGAMCYLKTNLTASHNATTDWEFAVLNTSS
ncbi:hypothetical protein PFICI_10473 [Pestalotiopsis fici W106-1]|uniref:Apple domain-containing protein n=1 Tax=Pestalotiopsis fici (strain W106-1 / CGMCC3.15140) TaxID=1229662 RepID=W3WZU7_PESFW|nr:uncharacterized protein PFICI_10473 [Pestalotiopsis fici W106-1]ETS78411.1 hypothetical protein PFICI_10473 [Pestalotiopsis fici W106-1]